MLTIKQAIMANASEGTASTITEALECVTGKKERTIAPAVSDGSITPSNIDAFIVSFSANGGSGTVASVACADGYTVELPDDTGLTPPSSKVFGGWATAADATKASYQDGDDFAATEDTTLYAFWTAEE